LKKLKIDFSAATSTHVVALIARLAPTDVRLAAAWNDSVNQLKGAVAQHSS